VRQTTTPHGLRYGAVADLAPQSQVARLMDGYMTTQLLYVAAKLGIADVVAGGRRTAAEIAEAVGADAALLGRALRGLVLEDILFEDGGRFGLTPLGEWLRDGVPGSLRGPILVRGELYYGAAAGLLATVVDGGTAFEHVHGERFFEHLGRHPDLEATFQASMTGRASHEADDVVAAYDFTGLERLVDVGGGQGVLLATILRGAPWLRAMLVDRPAVVARAREWLAQQGVGERCECVAGDFFASVPSGADAYVLSRVIHDWDDADANRILARCAAAMTAGSRLLLVEAIVPERPKDRPEAIRMDLHMLTLLGARERTEAEFRRLLAAVGLTVQRVVPTRSPAGLSVVEATL
jgi:hypothetical protein